MAKNVYEYESDETVTLTIFKNAIKWFTCIFVYLHAQLQLLFMQFGSKITFLLH